MQGINLGVVLFRHYGILEFIPRFIYGSGLPNGIL